MLVSALTDCEFEFRRFWLAQKFSEIDCGKNKNLKIQLAPGFEMNEMKYQLENEIGRLAGFDIADDAPVVDGVMFYHRETPYINATTPLVGWLKPEHISEQFPKIDTHPVILTENIRCQIIEGVKLQVKLVIYK